MNTTIPTWPLTSKLTWRERELLSLLQAGGHEWLSEPKLARVTLKFRELIDRLRSRGVPIQTLSLVGGAKFFRLGPKPPSPAEIKNAAGVTFTPRTPAAPSAINPNLAEARKEQLWPATAQRVLKP